MSSISGESRIQRNCSLMLKIPLGKSTPAGGGPPGSVCDERGRGGFGGLNLGGGAEDFFQGCQAGFDFVHAVGAEGFVALGSGQLADFGDGGALGDALFHGVVGD